MIPRTLHAAHYFMPNNPDGKVNGEIKYSEHLWGTTRNKYPKYENHNNSI